MLFKKIRDLVKASRIKGSYILSAFIVLCLGLWLATGEIIVGGQGANEGGNGDAATGAPAETAAASSRAKAPFRVLVRTFDAVERTAELTVRGRTEADQRVEVKAEVTGRVLELPFEKGASVKAGDIVCRIDPGARTARVLQAKAALAKAQLDHDAAGKLSKRGFAAETQVRATKAALDAAEAVLKEAELSVERSTIKAPFDGIIDHEFVEVGAYLNIGAPCVTITSLDPLLVIGQISERNVPMLKQGMPANGFLVTGEKFDGTIRFISPTAERATRTFRLEIEIANADNALRDGVTARAKIPLRPTMAHRFSAAYLSLDDAGNIGVKILDSGNIARFRKVTILDDERDGVWVAGLPARVTIVTAGQDYVADGEPVEPVPEQAGASR